MPRIGRKPAHAGSWYEGDGEVLDQQLEKWLGDVALLRPPPRAIIAPHAGYRFCGHVMAHAYRHIDPSSVSRVFLLGPSHHVYTRKCVLSSALEYVTPLGSLNIDQEVYSALQATGAFEVMTLDVDEAEHSLELHAPFIAKVMGSQPFKLVPIMVGALSAEGEAAFGAILGRYLDDPRNLFIISSDFCHWGSRFSYTFYERSQGPIWKSIQWLDDLGMRVIEQGDPRAFMQYLAQYKNTICGRHPIAVLLNMLQHCQTKFSIGFNFYDQSSKCHSMSDSSVSYATALVVPAKPVAAQ